VTALWDRFVAAGVDAAAALEQTAIALVRGDLEGDALRDALATGAHGAFSVGTQALLLGAADLGELALACEKACDRLAAGDFPLDGLPILASTTATLATAFRQLASPDKSGARTEGLPLEGARYELETLLPGAAGRAPDVPIGNLRRAGAPATATATVPATATATVPATATETVPEAVPATVPEAVPATATVPATVPAVWAPTVDEDMIELFFEEANERLDELSVKLIDIEQRPGDTELLRDAFRDLHTIKGSSAMVGLEPANKLAHAAEDLAGQVREGDRAADGAVVDALLAALDGLREIMRQAQSRAPITVDVARVVRRLRDPAAARAEQRDESPASVAAEATPAPQRQPRHDRQTIRVDFDKLDKLMNLVGELVLGRDGLKSAMHALSSVSSELSTDHHLARRLLGAPRAAANAPAEGRTSLVNLSEEIGRVERVLVDISQDLNHATGRLDSVSSDLRDQVMKLRMVPIGGVFRKHHRTVRDLAAALGKRATLVLQGDDTELDKLLVEALDDPLVHLVRNAVDHGIEPPDVRVAAGKPAAGTVRLEAGRRGNQVVIRIADDGGGIDPAALERRALDRGIATEAELATMDDEAALDLIFRPGFSTAEVVSEVSGRGVGMDVVKQTIVTRLKGNVRITSTPGVGSDFTLELPLTLAIIQVLLARAAGEVYAIPLDHVVRTLTCAEDSVRLIEDREVIEVKGRQVPLIRLSHVLELDADGRAEELRVVLVDVGGTVYGLACDHLLGKREIVIKPLGDLLAYVPCAAGATLLGDRCALILDVPAIAARALARGAPMPRPARPTTGAAAVPADAPHVLLVEDSDIVRESLRRLLADAGYRVTTAVDGADGLERARAERFDLVSTDVMMPRMDGYELTRALRATEEYARAPIIMVTSRGERIDRVRGFDAGVDEYITKPHDRALLLRTVRGLLGRRHPGGES